MYLTNEEIISLPQYLFTSVSEDGKKMAYVKRSTDWKANMYRRQTWIYQKESKSSFPLTIGSIDSTQPLWSPDSSKIAYLSPVKKEGKSIQQVFIHSFNENETKQVTDGEQSIEQFKWAPHDEGVYFLSKRPLQKERKKRKKEQGSFRYVDKEFEYNGLYYLALSSDNEDEKEPQLLFDQDLHIYSFDLSPTKQDELVISVSETPRIVDARDQTIYLVDQKQRELKKLPISPLQVGHVMYAPTGDQICYCRFENERSQFSNMLVESFNLNSLESSLFQTDIDENVIPVRWTEQGLLVTWQKRTAHFLGFIYLDKPIKVLSSLDDEVIGVPSISSNGQSLAYTQATDESPSAVFWNEEKIADKETFLKNKKRSLKERISWYLQDGTEVEGILSKPVDFDPTKRYPLIVCVHGGPHGTSYAVPMSTIIQPIEAYVEKGILVLEPNYRGSAGYGERFRRANYRNLGIGDLEDVLGGIDLLEGKGWIDSEKMGIAGWSQGGFIAAFSGVCSDRFKAISVGAGVTNWLTYYNNTDVTTFTLDYFGESPLEDEEIYKKTSPMTYIRNGAPPTLIQHGSADVRVPVSNANEFYRGLKDSGHEVEYVQYEGMGHSPTTPGLLKAVLDQNENWFERYLLSDKES